LLNRVPLDPEPIAHTVVAGEVRGGLGRRDDIVSGERVSRVRKADLHDLRTRSPEPVHPLLPERLELGGHAVDPILLRDADAHAPDPALEYGLEVGNLPRC